MEAGLLSERGQTLTPQEEGIIARQVAVGAEPILGLASPAAVAPSNGKGKVARPGKELARRR